MGGLGPCFGFPSVDGRHMLTLPVDAGPRKCTGQCSVSGDSPPARDANPQSPPYARGEDLRQPFGFEASLVEPPPHSHRLSCAEATIFSKSVPSMVRFCVTLQLARACDKNLSE